MKQALGYASKSGHSQLLPLLSLAYYSDDRSWDRGRLDRSFGARHSPEICGRDARGPRGLQS